MYKINILLCSDSKCAIVTSACIKYCSNKKTTTTKLIKNTKTTTLLQRYYQWIDIFIMAQQKCHFFCISAEYSLDQWRLEEIDLICKTDEEQHGKMLIISWNLTVFSLNISCNNVID